MEKYVSGNNLPKVYMIFCITSNTYYSTPKGKNYWVTPGAAKNAWNLHVGSIDTLYNKNNGLVTYFSEQSDFVIHCMQLSYLRAVEE